ncbi:hypothetical protein MB84_27500 (plasmid) [Pandoraea oxalativorans]|uniref:Uncharacterized protein n=1 Tax=Pandoraea oxalativorans TaxID=573737 RepID=A0A0G3IBM9_9BURK|nr:hypothetical protein MB84_27500 [Pandoraea oxalativorans]
MLAAMDVVQRRTEVGNASPGDGGGSDHDVIQAYSLLKKQLPEVRFSEDLDTGTLVITGLAAKSLTMTVGKDAIPYLRLQGWKDIASLFQSAHQDAAQGAFTRLVCAPTGAAQLAAFADLYQYVRYISPPPNDLAGIVPGAGSLSRRRAGHPVLYRARRTRQPDQCRRDGSPAVFDPL